MKASTLHYIFHWVAIILAISFLKYENLWSAIPFVFCLTMAAIFKELEE